jgi:HEAT repeat protein
MWMPDTPARGVLLGLAACDADLFSSVGAATAGPVAAGLVATSRGAVGDLVRLLGEFGDCRAVPVILGRLRELADSGTEAVNALRGLGDRSAVPGLLALCSPGDSGERLESVVGALAALGDPRAVGFLARVFAHGWAGETLAEAFRGLTQMLAAEAAGATAADLRAVTALPASRSWRYTMEGHFDESQEWVSASERTKWLDTAEVREMAQRELDRRASTEG